MIKVFCDICGRECKNQYTSGLGEYCDNCVERIKAHIKGLNLGVADNSTNMKK